MNRSKGVLTNKQYCAILYITGKEDGARGFDFERRQTPKYSTLSNQ